MPILTKAMEKYVRNETKSGYDKDTRRKYNRRIADYARKGIDQLTLLAEKLPEEELKEIFNDDTLRRFFANVLFKVEPNMDPEKRRRILGLWNIIIFGMGGGQFAIYLAPEGYRAVKTREPLMEVAAFIAIRSAILDENV